MLALPPLSLFPFAWAGMAAYLFYLTGKPSLFNALAGHAMFSLLFFCASEYWWPGHIAAVTDQSMLYWMSLLVTGSVVKGLLTLIFPVVILFLARTSTDWALACAPPIWLFTELLRSGLLAPDWSLLGYTQVPFSYLAQVADLGGACMVGFVLLCLSSLMAARLRQSSLKLQSLLAAVLILSLLYGVYRIHLWSPPSSGSLKVALIQPVVGSEADAAAWAGYFFEALPALYQKASLEGADWVIHPQAPNPYEYGKDFYYTGFLKRQVSLYRIPLLLYGYFSDDRGRQIRSSFLLVPRGAEVHQESESVLSRGLPGGSSSPILTRVGEAHGLSYAVLDGSVDVLFAGLFDELVKQGRELFVLLSRDFSSGDYPNSWQSLNAARMRAIEMRRTILRGANRGPTARIDAWGRAQPLLQRGERGLMVADVTGTLQPSIYSIIGDWPGWLLAIAGLMAAIGKAVKASVSARRK